MFANFLSAHWHTSQRLMSLSPVTTASAQRSIMQSSSVEIYFACTPFPAHVLGYRRPVTPILFAASLWLRPCFWTSRDTISALMGGRRFRTMVSQCIRVQVCFVMQRPVAA